MALSSRYDFGALYQQAKALAQSGEVRTFDEIALALGVNRNTLFGGMKRAGLVKRSDEFFEIANKDEKETVEAEYGDDFINIVCASRRIRTVDEAIKEFKVDLNEWEVDRYKVKTSEGYRKDRSVEWEVKDGTVTHGKVRDSGKMLIAPMYHVQVTLKRKPHEVRARMLWSALAEDARKHAPKYKRVTARKRGGLVYEVDMPDVHFGKLAWAEESGDDYDIKIARGLVMGTLERLLHYTRGFDVSRILLPMGNDFFNVDNKNNTTTHGTPQQEDTRWAKTFREGRRLAVDMIDMCLTVAPVDVLIIAGNHDEERSFYLGEVLDAFYSRAKDVTVDNSARKRKYLHFGNVLLGFTHGYHEKLGKLPSIMPIEVPAEWAGSVHREWHLGDKHHKKDLLHRTEDVDGVTIRLLRSLSATDTWHFDKGYVGTPRGAEAFLWDPSDGLVAQFQSVYKKTP